MPEETVTVLVKKVDQIALDIASIKAVMDEKEKLTHETRIRNLEQLANQWLGGKMLFLWLITTAIAVFAAVKH